MKKITATMMKMAVLLFVGLGLFPAMVSMVRAQMLEGEGIYPFQMAVRVLEDPKPGAMTVPMEVEVVRLIAYWEQMEKDKNPVTWLRCRVLPVTEVMDSKAEDVEIEGWNGPVELKDWERKPRCPTTGIYRDNTPYPFEIHRFQAKFKSNSGEYYIIFEIFDPEGHCLAEGYHSFLIDQRRIYHAPEISGCLGQQIRERLGFSKKDLTKTESEIIEKEYKRVISKRYDIKKQRQKQPQSPQQEKAPRSQGILKGQSIWVGVKWTGFQKANVLPVFDLRQATVEITNCDDPLQPPIIEILDDGGTCAFTAWQDDPHFEITLKLEHPGNGGINPFCIKSNSPIDTSPTMMEFQIGKLNSFNSAETIEKSIRTPIFFFERNGKNMDAPVFFFGQSWLVQ